MLCAQSRIALTCHVNEGLTPRAADTASPWARRGGWSGEVALPAVMVGRRRRAADAIVGRVLAASFGGRISWIS